MNTYQKQADDFLKKTGATLTINFFKADKYFHSDVDKRDIYNCELKRGNRVYKFTFGQSISKSLFYYTIGKRVIEIDRKYLLPEHKKNLIHHIQRESGYAFLNNGKSDLIHYPESPDAYDILACITKYNPGSFENFCDEYGYDTDSRTAEKIYNDVLNEWNSINRLFNDDEIEMLSEIQ